MRIGVAIDLRVSGVGGSSSQNNVGKPEVHPNPTEIQAEFVTAIVVIWLRIRPFEMYCDGLRHN